MHKVAIVGLPNSGKSTLFNRLTGRRRALVHCDAGMTRDRIYGQVEHGGTHFTLIDTGGVADATHPLQEAIQKQVSLAVTEADVVLVLLDGQAGLRPLDIDLVQRMRRRKPFVVAVNKVDVESHEERLNAFAPLGTDLLAVSAEHACGIEDLLDSLCRLLPADDASEPATIGEEISIAIIGRPNSGKSTLLNRLVGYERASVSEVPGTTRDTVDAEVVIEERRYRILDTAGIRRKARITDSQEIIAAIAARRTISRAHCTLLMLDGQAGIGAHDRYLASEVATTARSAVVLVNKVDVATDFEPRRATGQTREALIELDWARLLFVSALQGRFTNRILSAVDAAVREGSRDIATSELNDFLEDLFSRDTPKFVDGVRNPIKYGVQVGKLPVTLSLFCKRRTTLLPAYRKMMETRIRRRFGLEHSPIHIVLRRDGARSV